MGRTIMISREATPAELEVIDRKGGMRLNNEMRAGVVAKALEHAFGKRQIELRERSAKLGHLAMVDAFGVSVINTTKKLSRPWVVVCEDNWGTKYPDGVTINFRCGPYGKTFPLLVKDALPSANSSDSKYFKVSDAALVTRIEQLMEDTEALKVELTKTTATLNALLGSFAAYSTLEKGWPEGKPFYKHLPTDYPYRHQVPATLVSDLNKSLGI